MSAVVSFVKDVVGGVVEAVGDVVGAVVDVVKDVGKAIDKYVIQPILDDPLTAIATVAGATFLGPAIAPMLGGSLGAATGYVATGLGAAAGNTAAGLAQGESFDEAIKGGLMAGITAGATSAGFDYFTGAGAFAPDASVAPVSTPGLDYMPSEVGVNIDAFGNPIDTLAGTNPYVSSSLDTALTSPVSAPTLSGMDLPPLDASVPGAPGLKAPSAPSAPTAPSATGPVAAPEISPLASLDVAAPGVDYSLAGGVRTPQPGLRVPSLTPESAFTFGGEANYGLVPPGTTGGPGLQLPDAPNLARMRGGQGLTAEVPGMPEFRYTDGTTDTWMGDNGRIYGQAQPPGTISAAGFTPIPEPIVYEPGPGRSLGDKLKSFDFQDIGMQDAANLGKSAWNYAKENPLTTLAGVSLLAGGFGGPPQMPQGGPPQRGATRDANFNRPMDIYNYLRDRRELDEDIMRYGTTGGEHRFFENTRFVPVPIQARTGGLIQLKQKYQDGGLAQPMDPMQGMMPGMDPMMAMMSGPPMQAPQGQPGMAAPQGMPPGAQGQQAPQGALSQLAGQQAPGAQGQQPPQGPQDQQSIMGGQPLQLNPDPTTSYYQYGQPPSDMQMDPRQLQMLQQLQAMQAAQGQQGMPQGMPGQQGQPVMMNQGGPLNMVRSMNIGGGADGRSDDVDALLSDGEYVFDAETVALLGNGSSEAGADRLERMRAEIRKHKGQHLSKGKISPDAKSPLEYLKG